MNKKIIWLIVSCLMVVALVLASCAPAVVEEKEAKVVTKEPEKKVGEVVEEPVGEPQYGGRLTLVHPVAEWDAESWDPTVWWAAGLFLSPYQEYLLGGDPSKGQTGTGEHTFTGRYVPPGVVRGELAESWEFLTDPLRLVFHIRPGVYWQAKPGVMETRELTADDVAFSIKRRIYDPKTGAVGNPKLWGWIDSITATDKYTVTLELNSVYPEWQYLIGWGMATNIVPPELVEAGIEEWHNAVGTGPFMLTDYVKGATAKYTRNPAYWGKTTINGKEYQIPFVDELVYPIIKDKTVQLASLRTGKIDVLIQVPWEYASTLATTSPELRRWEVDNAGHMAIDVRHDTPPFDDIKVRQALSMAIDREYIIDTIHGGYGILDSFVFPRAWGEAIWTPMAEQPPEVQAMYEYNPERAKELLAEAGYPDGFSCEIDLAIEPLNLSIVPLIKDYWADIGVELELLPHEKTISWGIKIARQHKHMMFGGLKDAPSPADNLFGDYHPDGVDNISMYNDPTVNDWLDRYSREEDVDEQSALLKKINNYLIADLASIFLPAPNTFCYAWPWVMNYEGEARTKYRTGIDVWSIIWIDQDLKAEMGY